MVNDQRDAQLFSMYLFLFLTLYMFRAHRAHHHQERKLCQYNLWQLSLRVVCWSEVHFWPAHYTATDTEWQLPEVVLTQFVSPDDEHDVLETCRELKTKINTYKIIVRQVIHLPRRKERLRLFETENVTNCRTDVWEAELHGNLWTFSFNLALLRRARINRRQKKENRM